MKAQFFCVLFLALYVFCSACQATSNYTYKNNEYVTITHGLSPNRQYSLATHGDGEDGYQNFHVYLMREPGHKKIGPLTEIEDDILDTAANAYKAFWSPDSRYVAIIYRADRHLVTMNLYRVGHGRAFPITGFDLIRAVSKKVGASNPDFFQGEAQRSGYYEVKWQSSTRFALKEEALFYGPLPQPARAMKQYGRIRDDKRNPGETNHWANMVSVDAVCQLNGTNNVVQIVSTKPGKFTLYEP